MSNSEAFGIAFFIVFVVFLSSIVIVGLWHNPDIAMFIGVCVGVLVAVMIPVKIVGHYVEVSNQKAKEAMKLAERENAKRAAEERRKAWNS